MIVNGSPKQKSTCRQHQDDCDRQHLEPSAEDQPLGAGATWQRMIIPSLGAAPLSGSYESCNDGLRGDMEGI